MSSETTDRHSPTAQGRYELVVIDGTSVTTSALGPVDNASPSGFSHAGRLGESLDVREGREAAANAARTLLSALRQQLGSLDDIDTVLLLRGYLSATADFDQHAAVMDGASEVVLAALGDRGRHARTTIGVASLPFGIPIVVEMSARLSGSKQQ